MVKDRWEWHLLGTFGVIDMVIYPGIASALLFSEWTR